MKTILRSIVPVSVLAITLASCNLTPTNNTQPTNNTTVYYTPGANVGGVCVAINVVQKQEVPVIGTIDVNVPAAVGVFYNGSNYSSFVNAGTVQASDNSNTRTLNAQSNNSYVFEDYQSANFDPWTPSITWNVGGSANVTAFSHTTSMGMPSVSDVSIADGFTITKSNGLSLNIGTTVYADTLYINISGNSNTNVTKRIAANGGINSINFTAGELSVLSNTDQGIIQLAPCNFNVANYNTKDYVFINEAVYNRTGVKIQ